MDMLDNKYLKFFSWLFILITVVSLIIAALIIYPYKVIEIKSLEVLTPNVKAGELFRWRVDFCKYMNLKAKTVRKVLDQKNVVWLTIEQETQFAPGCSNTVVDIKIPEDVPPGTYRIKSETLYQINPFRVETLNLDIPEFQVTP